MVHLKSIEIKNFKSILNQRIEGCTRVNLFVGYPNTGKSNILEAIGLFSSMQLSEQHFYFNELCRIRHFSEVFFNKDYKETAKVIVNDNYELELNITQANDLKLSIRKSGDPINRLIFGAEIKSKDRTEFRYEIGTNWQEAAKYDDLPNVKKYEFNPFEQIDMQRPLSLAIPYGNNLLDILQRNAELRKEVANIFKEYKLKLFIDGDELKFLKYLADGTGVSIPYHQVADTLRRLVFYKTAILSNSNTVLIFEEPEAHMFPPYVSKFNADVMSDTRGNQYFITTHSPFVITDFLETLISDLSVFIVEYKKGSGETRVRKLTNEEMKEIYQYGVDLLMNLENFMVDE